MSSQKSITALMTKTRFTANTFTATASPSDRVEFGYNLTVGALTTSGPKSSERPGFGLQILHGSMKRGSDMTGCFRMHSQATAFRSNLALRTMQAWALYQEWHSAGSERSVLAARLLLWALVSVAVPCRRISRVKMPFRVPLGSTYSSSERGSVRMIGTAAPTRV